MTPATKRRRGRPETPAAAYADLGPSIRRTRAAGAVAAPVLVVDRPDPEKPQGTPVRGARAVIIYDWLHTHGLLTDEQREAADRYLVRLEQASGAVEAQGERVRGGSGQGTPTERQVSALADLRLADDALGADRDLVRLVVGWNMEPEDGLPLATFRAALGRLAAMWEYQAFVRHG